MATHPARSFKVSLTNGRSELASSGGAREAARESIQQFGLPPRFSEEVRPRPVWGRSVTTETGSLLAPRGGLSAREGDSPVLGFEPRSEAPQASRIIHCSGPGGFPARSYPTRARAPAAAGSGR